MTHIKVKYSGLQTTDENCVGKVNGSNFRFDGCIKEHIDIEERAGIRRVRDHIHGPTRNEDLSFKWPIRRIER